MISLPIGAKLKGIASVTGVVDYQVHGVVNDATAVLASGTLTSALTDLFTAGTNDIGKTFIFCNHHTAAVTINVYVSPDGISNYRILPKDFTLDAQNTVHTDGEKVMVMTHEGHPLAPSMVEVDPIFTASEAFKLSLGDKALVDTIAAKAIAPPTNSADYLAQWNGLNSKTLKEGLPTTSFLRQGVAGEVASLTDKAAPVDADVTLIEDSAAANAKKKLSWANIKATLKTYFDSLYLNKSGGTVINLKEQGSTVTITAGAATIDVATCDNSLRLTLIANTALTLSGVAPADKSIRLFITHTLGPWTLSWGGTDLALEGTSGTKETVVLTYTGTAWWAYRAGIVDVTI